MKIYFFHYGSFKRPKHKDKNAAVTVYEQRRNGYFSYIGYKLVNRHSYPGQEATASQILHDKFNYRWKKNQIGRELARKNIRLISLPIGVQDYHILEEK